MPPDVDALADLVLDTMQAALAPVLAQVAVLQALVVGREAIAADVSKVVVELRERAAVLETRAQVPGPAGAPGRDGVDGLGFDDLDLVMDDARKGCFLRFTRGDQVKEFRLPIPFDVGPYHDGEHYEKGNEVSWAGALWIAKAPTTDKPGEGATAWRLAVKKAKNGNDGKDGQTGPPGPRGPGWEETMDERRRR